MKLNTLLSISILGLILSTGTAIAYEESSIPSSIEQYYMDTHSVSLKQARTRIQVTNEANKISEVLSKYADEFSGSYIDNNKFKVVFLFKNNKCSSHNNQKKHRGDKGCNNNQAKKILDSIAGTTEVSGKKINRYIKTKMVTYSHSELLSIQENINAIAKGFEDGMHSSAIDVILNRVALVLKNPDGFYEYLENNGIEIPEGVLIEQDEGSDIQPLAYGGELIASGTDYVNLCTSGFVVKNTAGTRGIVTSAHCLNTLKWEQHNEDLTFKSESFPQDIQWHELPEELSSISANAIQTNHNPPSFQVITSIATPSVGTALCMSGYSSAFHLDKRVNCGTVARTGVSTNYKLQGNTTAKSGFNMLQVTTTGAINGGGIAINGDSGAPVYSGEIAMGLIHANDSSELTSRGKNTYITPINSVYALGLRVLTTK